jgi:hypothetical protein
MLPRWNIGTPRDAVTGEWHGITLYILDGKGAGQYRNLSQCHGRELEVERPWDILPDSSSVVSIGKFNGRHLFIGNRFIDTGTSVQLYPPNAECIVAENQIERVNSTNVGGALTSKLPWSGIRVEPSWFNQFLNNVIVEGNAWGMASSQMYVYGTNEDSFVPISRGNIVRSNTLMNNSSINISGAVADALVEGNTVSNSDVGIQVRAKSKTFPTGLLLRNNRFQNVGKHIFDEADNTRVINKTQ